MFDKLVESTKTQKQGRSRFFVVTSIIYASSLAISAVLSILWFNPVQAETANLAIMLQPPVPPPPMQPELQRAVIKVTTEPIAFRPPDKPPVDIPPANKVLPKPIGHGNIQVVHGVPNIGGNGPSYLSTDGANSDNEAPPPPAPVIKPTPKPEPVATPTPKPPDIVRVSSSVITGKALKKTQPPYPIIAKQVRAQGSVPVQILISEEGRVISAEVMGGHPTLREAARVAALQWVFSPTVVSGQNVKVSGVISFNFILN